MKKAKVTAPEDMRVFARRRLNEIGRANWPSVHEATGVSQTTIERIAYDSQHDTAYGRVKSVAVHLGYKVREVVA